MKRLPHYFAHANYIVMLAMTTPVVFAQTPATLHSFLPAVENWSLSQEVEVFNRDNLYERINGAAPLFLENNFQEMTSMEYTQGDQYITLQVYRHATPEDAFGMYASERSSEMIFYSGIGGEAQGDGYGLYFFAADFYVKMMASEENEAINETMKTIAGEFSKKIAPEAAYPAAFAFFPKEGLIPHTESYITQNYIGHEFLKPVYVANYEQEGKSFQAFVIDAQTTEKARQLLKDYFQFTRQTAAFTEGNLWIKDRYNGTIPVVWKGQYLVGAFDENGADFPEAIYAFLNRFLEQGK